MEKPGKKREIYSTFEGATHTFISHPKNRSEKLTHKLEQPDSFGLERNENHSPILFAHGMAGNPKAIREFLQQLADDSGVNVIAPNLQFKSEDKFRDSYIPGIEMQKINALIGATEEKRPKQESRESFNINLVATSGGTFSTLIFAKLAKYLDIKINQLILINPSRIINDGGVADLKKRSKREMREAQLEMLGNNEASSLLQEMEEYAKNRIKSLKPANIKALLSEIKSVATADNEKLIAELLNETEIPITIIQSKEDNLFPSQELAGNEKMRQIKIHGGHYSPLVEPSEYAPYIAELLITKPIEKK